MSNPNLTAENLKLFDEFYKKRLAEAGSSVRDDAGELAVARDILQAVVNDGLTPTSDGGASYVRRGARDWSDPTTVQAAQATITGGEIGSRTDKKKKGRLLATVGPAGGAGRSKEMLQGLGMLAAVLAIAGWFFWPTLFGRADQAKGKSSTKETSVGAQAAADNDTPVVEDGAADSKMEVTPVPTLQADMLADIIDAGGVKTGLVTPRTLEIRGVSYIIQPVRAQAGGWPQPETDRAASWVYGTVVNYVLGLAATPENKNLLASLSPGEEILLRMSTGLTYRFTYADVVRVSPQASEIFAQTRPGLVLVLLGDQDQAARIVIRAVYLPGQGENDAEARPVAVAGLAETVSVGEGLGLTCLGYEPKVWPDTPPGYVYLEVNFIIENRLKEPLATTAFVHQLIVEELAYPAVVQRAGAYPRLPSSLAPGQVFTTTAIYAAPEPALQGEITWEFAPDPAGPILPVVLPPYTGALTPVVTVKAVTLQERDLVITFIVQASPLHDLELSAADLKLTGGELAPIGNHFPWRLAAGKMEDLTLLVRPQSSPVMIGLLEQGFEISWKGGGE